MFKKLFTISILLAFASLTFGQNMILRSNGEQIPLKGASSLKEAIKTTKFSSSKGYEAKSYFPSAIDLTAAGKLDTVNYRDLGGNFNTNFGFFGQDLMFTWYQAHADMTIKAIGYTLSDDLGFDFIAGIEFRLMKFNWTPEQLLDFAGATKQGYYPSIGDGFNEVDPFGEEATGVWVSENEVNPLPPWTDNPNPEDNTWDYDLWSDGGFPWPSAGVASEFTAPVYNWLELGSTGLGEADVLSGEVFAIVVYDPEARLSDNSAEDAAHRIGFWSTGDYDVHDWKFYENGRGSDGVDAGWWCREFTWDLVVAVDVTGDTPPEIDEVTILGTTLSTEDRVVNATITDDNPGGGESGVASANLLYTMNDGSETAIEMTLTSGSVYEATIPGQVPGTVISYTIVATDVGGLITLWPRTVTYQIFEVTEPNALLVFNGPDAASGYPQSYYFGVGDFASYSTLAWDHDSWSYGALTADLVNNYKNIIEIASDGPAVDNSDVVKAWLDADPTRNYMLAGDEWLGAVGYGWDGSVNIPDGDFAKTVLGITVYHPDINYGVAGDEELPSMVNAVQGSALGDSLYMLHQKVSTDSGWTASIAYDPTYEIPYDNWLDGVEFVESVEVDMMGTGIDGNPYNIGGHRTYGDGNKIVFLAYDPLSLNSHSEDGGEYWWYGFTREAPQVQALNWFGAIVVGVEEDRAIPEAYELSQNYPNPFNPTTVISYSIPEKAEVTLTVFNLLGQNVATLASGVKNAGTHEAKFNARSLSSGVYFYTIQAGSFTSTKKMMLLK